MLFDPKIDVNVSGKVVSSNKLKNPKLKRGSCVFKGECLLMPQTQSSTSVPAFAYFKPQAAKSLKLNRNIYQSCHKPCCIYPIYINFVVLIKYCI